MKTYGDCTNKTALGEDGAETSMGTITLNAKAKRIIGVWATVLAGDTLTSTEAVAGIFRIAGDSLETAPLKFPLPQVSILTSGAVAVNTHIIPVNIPVRGLEVITGYITNDDASTGGLEGRVGIIYEGE